MTALENSQPGLAWGIKASLLTYVIGSGGSAAAEVPAQHTTDGFFFPLIQEQSQQPDHLNFAGGVHITAHAGLMSVTLRGLSVDQGARELVLSTTLEDGTRVQLARLSHEASSATGDVYAARLAADAVHLFGYNYPMGILLDPVCIITERS